LTAAAAIPAEPISRWVADLDDNNFAVREKASRELAALGDYAVPELRRLLAGRPSLEARRRAEQLLERPSGLITNPGMLRSVRAVEMLERLGNSAARDLLAELAKGDVAARLTREAKATLDRLGRRP
jgi:hypothetical protein